MNKIRLILSVAFLSLNIFLFSQTINEAGEAFNQGGTYFKAKDFTAAIDEYNKCINICKELGAEGEELLSKAQSYLQTSYINLGKTQYQANELDAAITSFQTAFDNATSPETQKEPKNLLLSSYYKKGATLLTDENYSEAIIAFDNALNLDGRFFTAYYGKALVYLKQENLEAFKEAADKVIELGPATNKTVEKIKSTAAGYFVAEGGTALQAGSFQKAIDLLNTSFTYEDGDSQAYYFLVLAYNGLSNWTKAIEAGNKALTLEQGSKSKIYFEMGKAYEGAGNKAQACSAYKNVVDGPNLEAAKYKVEVELKCN